MPKEATIAFNLRVPFVPVGEKGDGSRFKVSVRCEL
jgi:hypothetical protein